MLNLNNKHDQYTNTMTAIHPITAFILNNFQEKSREVSKFITTERISYEFFGIGKYHETEIKQIK